MTEASKVSETGKHLLDLVRMPTFQRFFESTKKKKKPPYHTKGVAKPKK